MPEFIKLVDGSLAVKGRNLVHGRLYTENNPYAHESNAKDGYKTIPSAYCEFLSAGTTMLSFRTDRTMGNVHGGSAGTVINPTFWVYCYKTTDALATGAWTYVKHVNTLKQAEDGRWYATVEIPNGFSYCNFRFNTYSDGTQIQRAKVWDLSMTYGDELLPYSPAPEDEEVT